MDNDEKIKELEENLCASRLGATRLGATRLGATRLSYGTAM